MYPKNIYINGKFLLQQESGVQAYAMGILNAMASQNINFEILAPKSLTLSDNFKVKHIGVFSNKLLWEQISLPLFIKRQKDAILINFCNSAPLLSKNQIVTIHDLAFEKRNVKWFSRSFELLYRFLIPRICKSSKFVFTVSEFSRKEIISHYKIDAHKVIVIPNGFFNPGEIIGKQINDDYILLLGGNNPRKNASCITSQIDEIEKRGLKLVILGQDNTIFNNKHKLTNTNIIYLNHVSKQKYYSLLKYSKALIYPSLYEGFGIPILESLCMKVPVVCNDLEVFRESYDDLPIYFNALHAREFERALDKIPSFTISDDDVIKLKAKYSFNNSVSLILKTLEKV